MRYRLRHDFPLDLFQRDVAHVLALHHVDHVLGDVLRVIADALERLGDEQDFDRGGDGARIFHHERDELAQDGAELVVDVLIGAYHLGRAAHVEPREAVERLAQHLQRKRGHAPDLDIARLLHAIHRVDQLGHARDLRRLVADALQVGDGLHHGHDQPQIARGRLTARDDGTAILIDADLHAVHLVVVGNDGRAQIEIAGGEIVDSEAHLLLDEAAHLQHTGPERFELLVELLGSMFAVHVKPSFTTYKDAPRFYSNRSR